MEQLTLSAVQKAYESTSCLSNEELYEKLVATGAVKQSDLKRLTPVGKSGTPTSLVKRKIRWHQQVLKHAGVIKASDNRGVWELAVSDAETSSSLHVSPKNMLVIGHSTDLGVSVWGDAAQLMSKLDQPIQLCFTSPPYPLQNARAYGNKQGQAYIDFICSVIEPIAKNLAEGGSIVLNLSNDIFLSKSPARSTYLERLTIEFEDNLGLSLMDRLVWSNPCKIPTPTHWCLKPTTPYHLKSSYEPLLWFTNNPNKIQANNRNILKPNSEEMTKLYQSGGDFRSKSYGDGAYDLTKGGFMKETEGTLMGNVITLSHKCKDSALASRIAEKLGIPPHGAMFPTGLASLLVKWLTKEGQCVVDPFSGSGKVGLAAEMLGRTWVCAEKVAEYMQIQRSLYMARGVTLH